MHKVFIAHHHAEAHLVRGLLQAGGIEAVVRGEALFTTVEAASVIPGATPEVWVLHAGQVMRAMAIIRRFQEGEAPTASGLGWICPECAETLEAQFTDCWNCGTPRPDRPMVSARQGQNKESRVE